MGEDDNYDELAARIKLAVKQLNVTLDHEGVDKDSELIPEIAIKGTVYIFCFSPGKKRFVKIANKDTHLSTNNVINTNNCIISVCKSKYKNKIILLSVIDNLIKGGSGQAVQNMNLRLGLSENEGMK